MIIEPTILNLVALGEEEPISVYGSPAISISDRTHSANAAKSGCHHDPKHHDFLA